MSSVFNLRKPKITQVSCPVCGVTSEVPTPPGVFKLEFICGKLSCRRQQLIKPYIPNEEYAMYFFTISPNGRKINLKLGSDSDPFSLEMYQHLGIAHTATSEEILDAYDTKRLALNPPTDPTPSAENKEEVARVEEAYKILSDPTARRSYNKFGLTEDSIITGEGGFETLLEVLNHMLGEGKFLEIIGEPVEIPENMEERLEEHRRFHEDENYEKDDILDKNRVETQMFRIADALDKKLCLYDPDHEEYFRNVIKTEAEKLRKCCNGPKLLYEIGNLYSYVGNFYGKKEYPGPNSFSIIPVYEMRWEAIREIGPAEVQEDFNYAGEIRDNLANRVDSITERQQRWERFLRNLNKWYWMVCVTELVLRILKACRVLFEEERNDVATHELSQKSNALKIIGEIYKGVANFDESGYVPIFK